MLSEKESAFYNHWEKVRLDEASFRNKLLSGLPMAFLFFLPVPVLVLVTYLFLPEWYAKISNRVPGSMFVILLALAVAVIFFSYFRMQFRWETNENLYLQLKAKMKAASIQNQNQSN